ncbi:flagellar biosynthesis protein FlhF [bacterium]|nr:flagellar biosynthesis protein FlhF [bacterium]
MRIKRFYGKNSNAALKEIKLAFGDNAVILETSQRDDGAPESRVEILAAIDYDPGLKVERKVGPQVTRGTPVEVVVREPLVEVREPTPVANSFPADYDRLQRELASVKGMMGRLLVGSGLNEGWSDPAFAECLTQLLVRKVSAEIAHDLLTQVHLEIGSSSALKRSEGFARELVKAALAGKIMRQVKVRGRAEMARVITLVGPTGVGKTTTLAKLASAFSGQGDRVALISVDTYRLGAAAQTLEYGRRLQMPVEIVKDRKGLLAALNSFAGFDRVLVDTMGRSIRDHKGLAELCRVLKVVVGDTFLVLTAGLQEEDLLENLVHFRPFGCSALLFTKLDETSCYGSILNGLRYARMPLSFFTNGQKVPDDIEIASSERLADLLLDIVDG